MADTEVTEVRRLIDGLRRDRRQHPHAGRREYSDRARQVAAATEVMIVAGRARDAVPLARRAVERVTAALLYMDDSSGIVGGDLRDLMDLYARACQAAPPDRLRLAAWLVDLHIDGPGWPRIELYAFAGALGERGLAEVARLEAERGSADPEHKVSWQLKDLREQLAGVSGDVDAHVAVLAEDLRGAHRYELIAGVLRAAGRGTDAERWAREGLAAYPFSNRSDELRDQLAGLLLDADRGADAVAVRWEVFEQRTLHHDYSRLRDTAVMSGQWPALRERALNLMGARALADPYRVTYLITVLIGEDLPGEAWAAAMASGGLLHESQWLQLIELRETGHPADVIAPYQDLIERKLSDAGDKYRYPRAVKLIKRLQDACHRAGDPAGFAVYMDDLRVRHKRKTAFIAALDKANLA